MKRDHKILVVLATVWTLFFWYETDKVVVNLTGSHSFAAYVAVAKFVLHGGFATHNHF